jgi:hypothetical protein
MATIAQTPNAPDHRDIELKAIIAVILETEPASPPLMIRKRAEGGPS